MFDLNKLWWNICRGLLRIVDALSSVFNWFAGILPTQIYGNNGGANPDDASNILTETFTMRTIGYVFLGFMILGIFILGISVAVGFMKSEFGNDDPVGAKKKMLGKSMRSLFGMVVMPIIFLVAVICIGVVLNFIVSLFSSTIDASSLGDVIANSGLEEANDRFTSYDIPYSKLKEINLNESYNYLLVILSSGCVIVGLFMACLTLVERIIHILFLYVISPVVLAKGPLDDGKSYEQWRDLVFSKFLGVVGIISCLYLFFLITPVIMGLLEPKGGINYTAAHKFAFKVARVIFIIAGVFTFTKAGTMFAHMVSASSGQFEGMSQGTSLGMFSTGMRLASGVLRGGMMGARVGMAGGMSGAAKGAAAASGGGSAASGGGLAGGGSGGAAAMAASAGGGAKGAAYADQAEYGVAGASPMAGLQMPGAAGAGGNGGIIGPSPAAGVNAPMSANSGYNASTAMLYGGFTGLAGYGLSKAIGAIGHGLASGAKKVFGRNPEKKAIRDSVRADKKNERAGKINDFKAGMRNPENLRRPNWADARAQGLTKGEYRGAKRDLKNEDKAAKKQAKLDAYKMNFSDKLNRKYDGAAAKPSNDDNSGLNT